MKYMVASAIAIVVWTLGWLVHYGVDIAEVGLAISDIQDPSFFLWYAGAVAFSMLACWLTAVWCGE
jgi:hypothetical protein